MSTIPPAEPTQPVPPSDQAAYPTAPAPKPTNVLSVISLIASIASYVFLPVLGAIAGIITGHFALSQIKRTGEQGRSLALWGTILGYVYLGLAAIIVAVSAVIATLLGIAASHTVHNITNSEQSLQQCLNQHPQSSQWALHCQEKFNNQFGQATN